MNDSDSASGEYFDRLNEKFDALSATQQKIGQYISANFDEVIFSSAAELGDRLDTSEAAIVRFAQAVGYAGFPDLKRELVRYYREQLTPGRKFENYLETLVEHDQFYAKVVEQEIQYLKNSVSMIDGIAFTRAVDTIVAADHRFVYATGANEGLAAYLSFRLNRFRLRSTPDTTVGRNIFERFPQFTKHDAVITYSFYQANADHNVLMDFLKRRGIPNVLITDTPVPPMVRNADIVLFARRGPYSAFHSLVVPMAITNALILAVAQKLGHGAIESLDELSAIRRSYQYEAVTSPITPDDANAGTAKS